MWQYREVQLRDQEQDKWQEIVNTLTNTESGP